MANFWKEKLHCQNKSKCLVLIILFWFRHQQDSIFYFNSLSTFNTLTITSSVFSPLFYTYIYVDKLLLYFYNGKYFQTGKQRVFSHFIIFSKFKRLLRIYKPLICHSHEITLSPIFFIFSIKILHVMNQSSIVPRSERKIGILEKN